MDESFKATITYYCNDYQSLIYIQHNNQIVTKLSYYENVYQFDPREFDKLKIFCGTTILVETKIKYDVGDNDDDDDLYFGGTITEETNNEAPEPAEETNIEAPERAERPQRKIPKLNLLADIEEEQEEHQHTYVKTNTYYSVQRIEKYMDTVVHLVFIKRSETMMSPMPVSKLISVANLERAVRIHFATLTSNIFKFHLTPHKLGRRHNVIVNPKVLWGSDNTNIQHQVLTFMNHLKRLLPVNGSKYEILKDGNPDFEHIKEETLHCFVTDPFDPEYMSNDMLDLTYTSDHFVFPNQASSETLVCFPPETYIDSKFTVLPFQQLINTSFISGRIFPKTIYITIGRDEELRQTAEADNPTDVPLDTSDPVVEEDPLLPSASSVPVVEEAPLLPSATSAPVVGTLPSATSAPVVEQAPLLPSATDAYSFDLDPLS